MSKAARQSCCYPISQRPEYSALTSPQLATIARLRLGAPFLLSPFFGFITSAVVLPRGGGMFQPQSTPFSSSSFFFSSLPSSHGVDFATIFALPQAGHAGDREPGPTQTAHLQQYLAHSQTGSLSSLCATDVLHPHQHNRSGQQLPQQPSSKGQQHHSPYRPAPSMEEQSNHDMAAQQEAAKDYQPEHQVSYSLMRHMACRAPEQGPQPLLKSSCSSSIP